MFDQKAVLKECRYEIKNYDGDKKTLSKLIESNSYLENAFIVINMNENIRPILREINYDFWVESRQLLHISDFINTELGNFPKNIKEIII